MVTDNFTSIAKFVAKLAYIHVVCNTYIPRVYIKDVRQLHSTSKSRTCVDVTAPAYKGGAAENSGIKIHEIQFSEIKFMNKKAGIASHER